MITLMLDDNTFTITFRIIIWLDDNTPIWKLTFFFHPGNVVTHSLEKEDRVIELNGTLKRRKIEM